jgi:group I intron endonuclease
MAYTVYMHTTPSGKVYIGITCRKPEYRWDHGEGYKTNKHFYNAIKKYGWDNISHEIIADGLSKEEACNMEIELIAKRKSNDPSVGYNKSTGGDISAVGFKHTAESKIRMSKVKSGKNNPFYGKHLTSEHKENLRQALSGEKNPSYGKHISEEAKQKRLAKIKGMFVGEKNPMYGRHHSAETAEKISKALKGKFDGEKNPSAKAVMCVETGQVFLTMKDAEAATGILWQGISHVVRGVRHTAGGFHWKYYHEEDQDEHRSPTDT